MRKYMRGLYSLSCEYRKIFLRDHFLHISHILEGIHFGANIFCTRANTGKYFWGIIYALVSCQGVSGSPEGDRSAIGKPEIRDCDRMAIGHHTTAPAVGILVIEVSVIGCDR